MRWLLQPCHFLEPGVDVSVDSPTLATGVTARSPRGGNWVLGGLVGDSVTSLPSGYGFHIYGESEGLCMLF